MYTYIERGVCVCIFFGRTHVELSPKLVELYTKGRARLIDRSIDS